MKKNIFLFFIMTILSGNLLADYSENPEVQKFMAEMVKKNHFSAEQLKEWFSKAEKKQSIIDAMNRPAEQTKPWKEYRGYFLTTQKIQGGVKFWQDNAVALARAEKEIGVAPEIIVAIIGVETGYGRNTGGYNVLDALSTLAFDYPPRADFFRSELENYLLLVRDQKRDPLEFKGSYAGAMGYGQFMPSSYRKWAIDFNGDGFIDIWKSPEDAIGSVANYFKEHGWKTGQPIAFEAHVQQAVQADELNAVVQPTLTIDQWRTRGINPVQWLPPTTKAMAVQLDGVNGLEYWFGLQNFYSITRYNRSALYAMAVFQLSQSIDFEMRKIQSQTYE